MKRVDERTMITEGTYNNSPRHYSSVQTHTDAQQNLERVHGLTATTNVYQSQHKNAYNPFASALADAFGIEETYA